MSYASDRFIQWFIHLCSSIAEGNLKYRNEKNCRWMIERVDAHRIEMVLYCSRVLLKQRALRGICFIFTLWDFHASHLLFYPIPSETHLKAPWEHSERAVQRCSACSVQRRPIEKSVRHSDQYLRHRTQCAATLPYVKLILHVSHSDTAEHRSAIFDIVSPYEYQRAWQLATYSIIEFARF